MTGIGVHTGRHQAAAGNDRWWHRALCLGMDPEEFFPPGLELHRPMSPTVETAVNQLRAICGRCPVQADCLADSKDRGDQVGFFGGQTPDERHGKSSPPARHFKPWADEDLAMLRHLHRQGYDDAQIAGVLGRTATAVRGQRRELRRGEELSLT